MIASKIIETLYKEDKNFCLVIDNKHDDIINDIIYCMEKTNKPNLNLIVKQDYYMTLEWPNGKITRVYSLRDGNDFIRGKLFEDIVFLNTGYCNDNNLINYCIFSLHNGKNDRNIIHINTYY